MYFNVKVRLVVQVYTELNYVKECNLFIHKKIIITLMKSTHSMTLTLMMTSIQNLKWTHYKKKYRRKNFLKERLLLFKKSREDSSFISYKKGASVTLHPMLTYKSSLQISFQQLHHSLP